MTYMIRGLDPADFKPLFAMADGELAERRAVRVTADSDHGFPCRVSLEDATSGEELVLAHHTSHDVDTPFRHSFAIYVRKGADRPAEFVDRCPPVFDGRPIALRCFSDEGMLIAARLALPGSADETIRDAFSDPDVAYIDAHNAAHGCFAARITRYEGKCDE